MPINTIAAGVDTSLSSKLNENFSETRHLSSRATTTTVSNTTSSLFQDHITLTSPTSTKANQVLLCEYIGFGTRTAPDVLEIELYNNTTAAQIAVTEGTEFFGATTQRFITLVATTTIVSVGTTASIKVRFRRASGSASSVTIIGGYLKLSLVES